MTLEPPPGYVDFVARNLAPLRRDAARVVGDESDADVLYQDVLTDVAARWSWLQLSTALGRSGVADTYLNRAFARRSERWHAGQTDVRSAPDIRSVSIARSIRRCSWTGWRRGWKSRAAGRSKSCSKNRSRLVRGRIVGAGV